MSTSPEAAGRTETPLARWRVGRGLTQKQMAELTGLTRSTYWRLETGKYKNPPLRYLVNCAIVLDVELDELLLPSWAQWLGAPDTHAPSPPAGCPAAARLGRANEPGTDGGQAETAPDAEPPTDAFAPVVGIRRGPGNAPPSPAPAGTMGKKDPVAARQDRIRRTRAFIQESLDELATQPGDHAELVPNCQQWLGRIASNHGLMLRRIASSDLEAEFELAVFLVGDLAPGYFMFPAGLVNFMVARDEGRGRLVFFPVDEETT